MARKNKSLFKYTLLIIGCLFALSLILVPITPVQAEITFKPPVTSAPSRSEGGASRDGGSCAIGKATKSHASIVKLLPKSNIGLTVEEHPSIMVYVPATTAQKAFFSIQDEQFNHHYHKTLQLPKEPGIMSIKFQDSPKLETGKNYKFSLVMICGEDLEVDDPLISGWIQRVKPKGNLPSQEPSVELASQLASNGLWYDAVSTLAELRKSQPSNQSVVTSWQQLLNSVGLSEIAQEPIIN